MNLKIGDKVKVEFVVSGIGSMGKKPTFSVNAGRVDEYGVYNLFQERIVEHAPKPPEIKVGFKFGFKNLSNYWEVVYIEEDFAIYLSRTIKGHPQKSTLSMIQGWITDGTYVEIT